MKCLYCPKLVPKVMLKSGAVDAKCRGLGKVHHSVFQPFFFIGLISGCLFGSGGNFVNLFEKQYSVRFAYFLF